MAQRRTVSSPRPSLRGMAVTTTSTSVSYAGNGSAHSFTVPFKFFASADLVVTTTTGGVVSTKTLGVDYTVAGAGSDSGGGITFTGAAPAVGTTVTIARSTAPTQPTIFSTAGSFNPKAHENALDRVTLVVQETESRTAAVETQADGLDTRVGVLEATSLLSSLTVNNLVVSVKDYGAKGDGVTDDLPAFNAAVTAVKAAGGGTINVPRPTKMYRLTGQWLIGTKFVNESDITAVVSDYSAVSSYSSSAATTAASNPLISVVGEPGAIIWTDYAPSIETAAIYYGIRSGVQVDDYSAEIKGLTIVAQAGATAGVFNQIAGDDPVPGNQVGIFAAGCAVKIRDCIIRECKRALITTGCYWGTVSNISVIRCVDGVFLSGANAVSARNFKITYAHGYGMIASGQGVRIHGLDTEQCAVDLWVPSCDNLELDGTYLESVSTGHTDYSIRFGVEAWKPSKTVVAGDYRTNDTRKLYLCTTGGTTAGSGGPTGTGTAITDNGAVWKYVGTVNANQCVYARLQAVHSSRLYGRHMLLASAEVKLDTSRFYSTNVNSLTWMDDTVSDLVMDNSQTTVDPASPGIGNVSTWDGSKLSALNCLAVGNSSVDTTVAGKSSGIQMGTHRFWFDLAGGVVRWKQGVPADQTDGNAITPRGDIVNWTSFPSTAAGAVASKDVTWTGSPGDAVTVAPVSLAGTWPDGVILYAYVRSTNTIRVVCLNLSGSTFNPGSFTFQLNWQPVKL